MVGIRFNQAYKTIRNRLRRFTLESILDTSLDEIQSAASDRIDVVMKTPWLTMLIVKWGCQDSMAGKQAVTRMTVRELSQIKNDLWILPERLEQRDNDDSYSVFLMLRQAFNPQFEFQKKIHFSFIRESALIASLGPGHGLYRDFLDETGLSPEEFIDFSMATFLAISRNQLNLPNTYYRSLELGYTKTKIDCFINLVSADLNQLVDYCRHLPDAKKKNLSELYEFPAIARFPFYRSTHEIRCWHRNIFLSGLSGLVHSVMSERKQKYIQPFSRVFEQHVITVGSEMGGTVYTDKEIRKYQPIGAKNPDLLVSFDDCNIFIEVKAGLFTQSVMTAGHSDILRKKTKAIRTAIDQARSSSNSLKEAGTVSTQVLQATREYLLIVTNKEVHAGNGETLASMYPSDSLEKVGGNNVLQLSNIYTVSVDDFERMAVACKAGAIYAPKFLENCVVADRDKATKRGHMSQHLTANGVPMYVSELVKRAAMDSVDRVGGSFQI